MKTKWITYFSAIILIFYNVRSSGQHLDIEGNAKIRGNIDINHQSDTTSVHIGRSAGVNTDFSERRFNTFVGTKSGTLNITGSNNSFFGSFAGGSSNGNFNVGFGLGAGFLTTGNNNCFIGANAGTLNTTGEGNVYVGRESGYNTETGDNNIALGQRSLYINDHGFQNIAIGQEALYFNYNNYNIAIGTQALYNTNTGPQNTALGGFAGYDHNNAQSTFIGYGASSTVGVTNGTAIGYDAKVNDNNKVRIGNGAVTVIEGNVAFSPMSDRRLKENIEPIPLGLDFILDLNPVVYHRTGNKNSGLEMGLIAQELDSLLKLHDAEDISIINRGNDGYLSVRYNDLFSPLIKAIQEQQVMIEALLRQNEHLLSERKINKREISEKSMTMLKNKQDND